MACNCKREMSHKRRKWIIKQKGAYITKVECPTCHRRFEYTLQMWKCCPICLTIMDGEQREMKNDAN